MESKKTIIFDKREDFENIIENFDAFVLDCDGVIYSGGNLIENVDKTIMEILVKNKKKVFFLSNASHRPKERFVSMMNKILKLEGSNKEFSEKSFTSPNLYLAKYLKSINFSKTVFYIGAEEGISTELNRVGIKNFRLDDLQKKENESSNKKIPHVSYVNHDDFVKNYVPLVKKDEIGAVVVGFDHFFDFGKLCFAHLCLTMIKDCLFFVTDGDYLFPWSLNQSKSDLKSESESSKVILPGTFSYLQSILTSTGRNDFKLIGKPNNLLLEDLIISNDLDRNRILVVGDNLNSDIKMANSSSVNSLLVLSGCSSIKDLNNNNFPIPSFCCNSLGDFFKYLSN